MRFLNRLILFFSAEEPRANAEVWDILSNAFYVKFHAPRKPYSFIDLFGWFYFREKTVPFWQFFSQSGLIRSGTLTGKNFL